MSHIFISYSKKNRDYTQRLTDNLMNRGFDVWVDDQIEPGEDWWRIIRQAIRDCAAFTIVMTPESEASHWVQLELLHALEYKKPIFPLFLAGDPNLLHSDAWSRIANIQFTNVENGALPSDGWYVNMMTHGVPCKLSSGTNITQSESLVRDTILSNTSALRPTIVFHSEDLKRRTLDILPPPFDWCDIKTGDQMIIGDATYDIPAFIMAKYPITNAQFQVFVDAHDGYNYLRWWDYSQEAWLWRIGNSLPKATACVGDDVPRTNVCWYESVAFCRWLTNCLNVTGVGLYATRLPRQIMLPTEQQWQRAAQGDDGRMFPWGSNFDSKRSNTEENRVGKLTPVTQYPNGTSPYGVFDMSGNVWEWCLTTWERDIAYLWASESRVLRGGSFGSVRNLAAAAYRDNASPNYRYYACGLRVVCAAAISAL